MLVFHSTALIDVARTKLIPHEYLTLARHYKFHRSADKERLKELFRALIQYSFRKNAFDSMGSLKCAAIRADPADYGYLTRPDFVRIVKACRAPLNGVVLNFYLDVTTGPDGRVNYSEVIADFDWINNPSKKLSDIPQNVRVKGKQKLFYIQCELVKVFFGKVKFEATKLILAVYSMLRWFLLQISKNFDYEKYFGIVTPAVCYRNFLLDVQQCASMNSQTS